jgi:hypothetical protein
MITRIFYKLWKYSFWCFIIIPFVASLLLSNEIVFKYLFIPFGTAFLFLTIVCFLFAMAAPPVVTVRIERDD